MHNQDLPVEIMHLILSYFCDGLSEFAQFSSVCSYWRYAANCSEVWLQFSNPFSCPKDFANLICRYVGTDCELERRTRDNDVITGLVPLNCTEKNYALSKVVLRASPTLLENLSLSERELIFREYCQWSMQTKETYKLFWNRCLWISQKFDFIRKCSEQVNCPFSPVMLILVTVTIFPILVIRFLWTRSFQQIINFFTAVGFLSLIILFVHYLDALVHETITGLKCGNGQLKLRFPSIQAFFLPFVALIVIELVLFHFSSGIMQLFLWIIIVGLTSFLDACLILFALWVSINYLFK